MRAPLVLLSSLVACHGKSDEDSYDRRDDSGTVAPDDSGTDDTDDSATGDDSTPPDDSATPVYGLDDRPTNATCLAPARPASEFDATWEQVFPALSFDYSIQITHPPGDDSWLYVVQQDGKVYAFENRPDVKAADLVLDKSSEVNFDYAEMGLLSIAFHPDFATNGEVFLAYNESDGGYHDLVTRVTTAGIGQRFDDSAEQTLLDIDDPASNHNGGQLAFGPDGYLYVATGDGGGASDTYGNGQNPDTLLAKILRLDVDGGDPYAIPADNPWADGSAGVPEMFAWGFRNPWRFHFDVDTGQLWVGDVGQNKWEEIHRVLVGGNYGWPVWEGAHCATGSTCDEDLGYVNPVVDYDPGGSASVIMGPVYRGSAFPALVGIPLFTDFYNPDLQGVFFDEKTNEPEVVEIAPAFGVPFAGLGTDEAGEVFAVDYYAGGGVYELVPATGAKKDLFPELLSETGCVYPTDPTVPAVGLIPYAPNAPFWSDGARQAPLVRAPRRDDR